MAISSNTEQMSVIAKREDFDSRSGNLLERVIFNNRLILIIICGVLSVILAYQALQLEINASFKGMMPQSHPFIQNAEKFSKDLRGLGNSVRIVVENTSGDIYNANYMEVL